MGSSHASAVGMSVRSEEGRRTGKAVWGWLDLEGEVAGEQLMLQLGHHEVPVLQQASHAAGHRMAHPPLLVPHRHLAPAADDCHRVTACQHSLRLCKGSCVLPVTPVYTQSLYSLHMAFSRLSRALHAAGASMC